MVEMVLLFKMKQMSELEQHYLMGQTLFVAKITEDLIGIATIRVGLGTTGKFCWRRQIQIHSTLFFRNVGTGDTHSFTTNYSVITGQCSKKFSYCFTARQLMD